MVALIKPKLLTRLLRIIKKNIKKKSLDFAYCIKVGKEDIRFIYNQKRGRCF